MVVDNDDNILIETSPNSKNAGGYYQLVLIDKKGDILERYLPYKPQGSSFVTGEIGMLKKTEKGILYSKPFGDTIFQIAGNHIQPLFALNMDGKSVKRSEAMNIERFLAGAVYDRGYLMSSVECVDNLLVFTFLHPNQQLSLGFYDMESKEFINSRSNSENDLLSILMRFTRVIGQENKQVIFEVTPRQANYLNEKFKPAMRKLKSSNPQLYNTIQSVSKNEMTGLVYFNLTKNAEP